MPISGGGGIITITSQYQGPGDIVPGATSWYGTRAYSLAAIGKNAVTITWLDAIPITYPTVAGGNLPIATMNSDAITHGTPATVTQVWDQVGTQHLNSAPTAFPSPQFVFSGNIFALGFTAASSQSIQFNGPSTVVGLPFTMNLVARHNATTGQSNAFQINTTGDGNSVGIGYRTNANNQGFVFDGTNQPTFTVNDTFWNTIYFSNSVSTDRWVLNNNTPNTGTAGTLGAGGGVITLSNSAVPMDGFIVEAGLWPIEFNTAQINNMYNNQSKYYGGAF